MDFFNNHRRLFSLAFWMFVSLTMFVAILPALNNQANNAPLPGSAPLSADAEAGKRLFISNGCVACHTQQVRSVDMDRVWGDRPGVPADYAAITRTDFWRNTATLMGTERTGPDLTNVGSRQPGLEWNLIHLYQPRAVVSASIMPAYPWLFGIKSKLDPGDVEVAVPDAFRQGVNGKIVATKEALQLVAYLQSLKQTPLPGAAPAFLYGEQKQESAKAGNTSTPDGAALYAANCQSCHQENGEGLKGAFPPLKGSPVVNGDSIGLYVTILMKGYDPRPEYGVMPAVGTNNHLTAEEITAILNFERSSWGNKAQPVTVEEVKKFMDALAAPLP